jgi:choline dehydrogenase-like flavoprotein
VNLPCAPLWEQGAAGWGWSDVLPFFKKQTDHFLGESEHHGIGGEWRIEAPRVQWALLDAFRKAAAEELLRAREEALAHMRRAGVVVLDVAPQRAAEAVVAQYLELKRRGRL